MKLLINFVMVDGLPLEVVAMIFGVWSLERGH